MGKGMMGAALALLAGLSMTPAAAQDPFAGLFGADAPKGEELEKLIAEAQAHPLGSKENPVRAEMPAGQRAYLARLRCANGARPTFARIGSYGAGVYGRIIDGYKVECKGGEPAESTVFMDMYHPGHVETATVPGFTIVAPR